MRIAVFSDGTGNSSAKLFRTNVWRLYEALDLCDSAKQVAFYDNGVGTAAFKPLAVLGGAFGLGLKRNVRDAYMFICRNYAKHPGPHEISAFGFSRGAFTIRVLLGLIRRQGLVPYHDDERELKRLATSAYREYRAQALPAGMWIRLLRGLRNAFFGLGRMLTGKEKYDSSHNVQNPRITFVGLWDTVAAYGLPVIELTRGWDRWVWPLNLPTRQLSPNVEKACHALALDDERQTFHPLLWDERGEPSVWRGRVETGPAAGTIDAERLSQVWFSGMHSNVGGGYPDDGMAYDSLVWIAQHATGRQALVLKPSILQEWERRCTASAPMSDSRAGVGAYYRYMPRLVSTLINDRVGGVEVFLPKIHSSVFNRIRSRIDGYAPITLPAQYAVTDGHAIVDLSVSGQPVAPAIETLETAAVRSRAQEAAWDHVWYRRIAYFMTVAATATLVVVPFVNPVGGDTSAWLRSPWPTASAALELMRGMVPSFVSPLFDYYRDFPLQLVLGGAVVVGLMLYSSWVERRNADTMRKAWITSQPRHKGIFLRLAHATRTFPGYVRALDWLRHWAIPNLFGIMMLALIVVGALVFAVRLSNEIPMALGYVCQNPTPATGSGQLEAVNEAGVQLQPFDVKKVCQPMGVRLEPGVTYEISVAPMPEWGDATNPVRSLAGFTTLTPSSKLPFLAGFPFLRHRLVNWFVPIVRVGNKGQEYHAIARSPSRFKTQMGGPLFMYVNDALAPYPSTFFYDNNKNHCTRVLKDGREQCNDTDNASPARWSIKKVSTDE